MEPLYAAIYLGYKNKKEELMYPLCQKAVTGSPDKSGYSKIDFLIFQQIEPSLLTKPCNSTQH